MCSLFLGSLSLKKKSQRVVPFAALANFAFARGHGDAAAETAARRFAFAVTAELVAALLRDCETSEEVWRAGVSVLSALGSNPEGDDEQEEKQEASDRVRKEKENAARLRVAALDAAVAKASSARDAIQAVVIERVSKIETIATRFDENRLVSFAKYFATGVVASPIALVALRVCFFVFRLIFGKRKVSVPRRVKNDSVPLRTPTPDKKTVPFGARTRAQGRTIRSPEGEVLRFA